MPVNIRIRFGRAIRRIREAQEINQEEAAERCGDQTGHMTGHIALWLARRFSSEMQGSGSLVRRNGLLHDCDVHTLLRLPTGIFYAQDVKANVLFFDRRVASEKPWTKKLWIYDFRTNEHFTLKTNPLRRENLDDFVACYHAENRHKRKETDRFRAFSYDDLVKRDKASLDIFWLKDDSLEDAANLPAPDVIAAEIVEDLQAALDEFGKRPVFPSGVGLVVRLTIASWDRQKGQSVALADFGRLPRSGGLLN